jgi:glycosyltransferase involved in cell wall biosynthesis
VGIIDVWYLAEICRIGEFMLTVLMFCPQFRPIVGGAERQAEKLSKALVQKGVRVTVLTPCFMPDSPAYEEDEGLRIQRFPLLDICKRFPKIRGLGPLNLLSLGAQTSRAVMRQLDDVDVVHTHIASPLTAFAMLTAQIKGIPVICKVAMADKRNDLGELSIIGIGGPFLARTMISRLDCWVATTQAVRDSLESSGVDPQKIVGIPNGVVLPESQVMCLDRPSVSRFLYLGRLSTNIARDIPTLVNAFDRLADQFPFAELALVGDGDLYQETADLVAKTQNRHRIVMPGLQQPEKWLAWADCMVLPSRREGLSNALLEAMSYGLPCIANDIPPNREVLDNGSAGILVPVGDKDRLYYEMQRLATDQNLSSKMGVSALNRVKEHYSIDAVAEQYINLYQQFKDPCGRRI